MAGYSTTARCTTLTSSPGSWASTPQRSVVVVVVVVVDPGRVPHRGLQAISIAKICTAFQVFSAANSVIPEIGAINDWDNVAIVMKFSSGTLAQVKQDHRLTFLQDSNLC